MRFILLFFYYSSHSPGSWSNNICICAKHSFCQNSIHLTKSLALLKVIWNLPRFWLTLTFEPVKLRTLRRKLLEVFKTHTIKKALCRSRRISRALAYGKKICILDYSNASTAFLNHCSPWRSLSILHRHLRSKRSPSYKYTLLTVGYKVVSG